LTSKQQSSGWSLTLGEPYEPGVDGYTTRAVLPGRHAAVLKLVAPHRENEHEADALALWDGDGAVALLARDESGTRSARALRARDAALDGSSPTRRSTS
jgi:hypothetical protein